MPHELGFSLLQQQLMENACEKKDSCAMLKLMERGEPIVKDLGNADASSGGRKLEVDAHSTGCSDTTGLETAVALTNH